MTGPSRLRVFAVEDTSLQLTWGHLDAQEVRLRAGDVEHVVEHAGGPAAPVLDGLPPGAAVSVELAGDGWRRTLRTETLAPPPGDELFRLASISDMHLGLGHFGFLDTMKEHPEPTELHPVRCTRAALHEAKAWGAQHLVVKGDITNDGTREQWELFRSLLDEVGLPCEAIPGNHEVRGARGLDPDDGLAHVGLGIVGPDGARAVDLPGLRVVLINTTTNGKHEGRLDHVEDQVAQLVADADRPVLLAAHHYLMFLPFPTFWPPGIPSHHARRFLARMHRLQPNLLFTSGHTHRNRRRRIAGVEATEVGSPKDFPGGWGGYVVHEGGIRQVVRRVAAPDCLPWLERTRWAALGAWGRWSPGRLDARCFSLTWSAASGSGPVEEGGHRLAGDRG